MSQRAWELDTPGAYDRIHCAGSQVVDENINAIAYIRYTLNGVVVSDTEVEIAAVDYVTWRGSWDPDTHEWEEYLLEQVVTQESLPAGSLQYMS